MKYMFVYLFMICLSFNFSSGIKAETLKKLQDNYKCLASGYEDLPASSEKCFQAYWYELQQKNNDINNFLKRYKKKNIKFNKYSLQLLKIKTLESKKIKKIDCSFSFNNNKEVVSCNGVHYLRAGTNANMVDQTKACLAKCDPRESFNNKRSPDPIGGIIKDIIETDSAGEVH